MSMPDFVGYLLFLAGWIVLQRYLLPRLGVSTGMAPRAPGGPDDDSGPRCER